MVPTQSNSCKRPRRRTSASCNRLRHRVEEQIEAYIADRQPLVAGRRTEWIRMLALVSAWERREVGLAILKHDQAPIENRAGRQPASTAGSG